MSAILLVARAEARRRRAALLTADTRRAAPETGEIGAGRIEDGFLDGVSSAIDVVVIGLGVFALVTGVAGLIVLTQAVARQVDASGGVDEALGAVGLTGSQRALAVLVAAVAGLVLAAGPAWREARRPPVEMLRVE